MRRRLNDHQISRMAEGIVNQIRKTPSSVRPLNADPAFFILEDRELTDAETRALLTQGVRDEITQAINRITGRVN